MSTIKKAWQFCLLSFVATMALSSPSLAVLEVDITNFNLEPVPVSVADFVGESQIPDRQAEVEQMAKDVREVLIADLERSGLFRSIPREAFIQTDAGVGAYPRYADWRAIGSDALVVGTVQFRPNGDLVLSVRLWDVFGQDQLVGRNLIEPVGNWRKLAHRAADLIYEKLTGESGYFSTRIVYVAESGPLTNRVKRLAIMDQDGANHEYLTDGSFLALTPRFSPTLIGKKLVITYLSYQDNRPRVYLKEVGTDKEEMLGEFDGMTFAPRFSPDGNKVVMSLIQNGSSDIYEMDLLTRDVRQLTRHPDIDTSPSYSPDGRRLVFESDRSGSQQIYVMDADGSNVKRISFGRGRYKTPVWSPRGDLIAFTHSYRGRYSIGVMRTDGSQERLLTESFLDEGPTWSPNGRVLMFFRQKPFDARGEGGSYSIWSIDLTGRNEREIPATGDASDPAWSPLIP